ncbi:protein serine/threonine phosphatase 2C family protein [Candidatus Uhrbacteria bacterium]|nr:protein serine/threonine phosphatase 2C family protein [Candidatus Uhrbacteria bacterium]
MTGNCETRLGKRWCALSGQGKRLDMEDRHILVEDIGGLEGVTFAGVFDAHFDAEPAEHCVRGAPGLFLEAYKGGKKTVLRAIRYSFAELERSLMERLTQDEAAGGCSGGCAGGIVAMTPRHIAFGHVGDVGCILVRRQGHVILHHDHSTDNRKERARILAHGGEINGQYVSIQKDEHEIQMTRVIGDYSLKGKAITARPSLKGLERKPDDLWLVLASDWLWREHDPQVIVAELRKRRSIATIEKFLTPFVRGARDNATIIIIDCR